MLLVTGSLFMLSGCDESRTSGKGLYLPRGDVEQGRLTFIELECNQCHTVTGSELPVPEHETPMISFNLGGDVARVRTYGELVTAIVNPAHIVSEKYLASLSELVERGEIETPMPDFNEQMTVSQLIDLVAFLDSHYQKVVPSYIDYPYRYGSPYVGPY